MTKSTQTTSDGTKTNSVYFDFDMETQCGEMDFQMYVDYIDFCRANESYKWYNADATSLTTWYGYALLNSVESYSVGAIIHLD